MGIPSSSLIDTGASMTSVSEDLAEQAGLQDSPEHHHTHGRRRGQAKLSEADIELRAWAGLSGSRS